MKRFSLTLISLSLAGSLFAQSSSSDASSISSAFKTYWEKLKASPLKMELALTSESLRNGSHVNGTDNVLDVYAKYKLTDKDMLRLNPSFEYVKQNSYNPADEDTSEFYFQYVELLYRRTLLTADKNGFSLSADLRQAYIPSDEYRDSMSATGWTATRLNFSKDFGKFNLTSIARLDVYNRTSANPANNKTLARWYIIPGYTITDKLSASTNFYWTETTKAAEAAGKHLTSNYVSATPQLYYAFSKDVSGSLYTIFKLTQSGDGRTIVKDWNETATFGANLTLSVF
ncbi:MAG: hypothetical protein U0T83_03485 [Bacteriovoracaceae bacterium]